MIEAVNLGLEAWVADQNQNNGTHELEVLQTIKYAAEGFLKAGKGKVPLGDLVASAAKRNPAKIPPHSWLPG